MAVSAVWAIIAGLVIIILPIGSEIWDVVDILKKKKISVSPENITPSRNNTTRTSVQKITTTVDPPLENVGTSHDSSGIKEAFTLSKNDTITEQSESEAEPVFP